MHRMPRRQRGPLPMRHLAQRALLVTAAPALALPSPTPGGKVQLQLLRLCFGTRHPRLPPPPPAYCDLDRGQILPRRSDTPAEGVHAQIEVFLWGLKKAEAISIACARGLYVGRPDEKPPRASDRNRIRERLDRGEDTPRPDMYQLYRAADRTSPPAPVIAQAGRTRGLKLIVHPRGGVGYLTRHRQDDQRRAVRRAGLPGSTRATRRPAGLRGYRVDRHHGSSRRS